VDRVDLDDHHPGYSGRVQSVQCPDLPLVWFTAYSANFAEAMAKAGVKPMPMRCGGCAPRRWRAKLVKGRKFPCPALSLKIGPVCCEAGDMIAADARSWTASRTWTNPLLPESQRSHREKRGDRSAVHRRTKVISAALFVRVTAEKQVHSSTG